MAEYIEKELPFNDGNGKKSKCCKILNAGNIGSKEFVKLICSPGSGLDEGDVAKVMCRMVDELKQWLAKGHSVTIGELGTFRLSLGFKDDAENEDSDDNDKKTTARNIKVRGVNFRPEKQFVREIGSRCKLRKGSESINNRSSYTLEERLRIAQDYLDEKHFMRVRDYAAMTRLPHTTAANELRSFSNMLSSGITSEGRGNTKVYVKSPLCNEGNQ